MDMDIVFKQEHNGREICVTRDMRFLVEFDDDKRMFTDAESARTAIDADNRSRAKERKLDLPAIMAEFNYSRGMTPPERVTIKGANLRTADILTTPTRSRNADLFVDAPEVWEHLQRMVETGQEVRRLEEQFEREKRMVEPFRLPRVVETSAAKGGDIRPENYAQKLDMYEQAYMERKERTFNTGDH